MLYGWKVLFVCTVESLINGHFETSIILLLYRGCPLSEVTLYCHDPVGTTELVLNREVKCNVSLFEGCFIREVPLCKVTPQKIFTC